MDLKIYENLEKIPDFAVFASYIWHRYMEDISRFCEIWYKDDIARSQFDDQLPALMFKNIF